MKSEKRPKSSPKSLKNIAAILLNKWTKQTTNRDQFFAHIWKQAVGDQVSEHTAIDKFYDGKLYVFVENSIWMNELTFLKDQIKININKGFLNHNLVAEEIIFKIGKITKNTGFSSNFSPKDK
jgi:predicted nucleic acid-binding Zn ribbon protein